MQSLQLRLHKVECLEEVADMGNNEIVLGGISVDANGGTKQIPTFTVSDDFEDGMAVTYSPPNTFASFEFAADDTFAGKPVGWPRTHYVTFLLCEVDNGGFPQFAHDIYAQVKQKVTEEVKAAVTALASEYLGPLGPIIGAAAGYVVGWVLDTLFGWLVGLWEDDPFAPITVGMTLPSAKFTWGEGNDSPNAWVGWKVDGGHYRLYFDWQLRGAPVYAAVYRAGNDGHAMWSLTRPAFEAKYKELTAGSLRPVSVTSHVDGSTPMLTGAFQAGTGKHALAIGDWATFIAKWSSLSAAGLRLTDIDSYLENGTRVFVGVYREGTDPYLLWAAPWDGFIAKLNESVANGLRLVGLDTFVENGTTKYVGVFRKGSGGHAFWSSNITSFTAKWKENASLGLRLVRLSSHMQGNTRMYSGVFAGGTDGYALWYSDRWDDFTAKWKEYSAQGLRLIDIET